MAINREKKETLVSGYTEKLQRSQAMIVTEYRGLTHKQLEGLRRDLRGCESELAVSKNTLLARALREVGQPVPEALLTGPTAVVFCYNEIAAPAKVLTKFAKDSKIMVLRGGMVGPSVFDAIGRTSPDRTAQQGSVAGPGGRHAASADRRAGQRPVGHVARLPECAQRTF